MARVLALASLIGFTLVLLITLGRCAAHAEELRPGHIAEIEFACQTIDDFRYIFAAGTAAEMSRRVDERVEDNHCVELPGYPARFNGISWSVTFLGDQIDIWEVHIYIVPIGQVIGPVYTWVPVQYGI